MRCSCTLVVLLIQCLVLYNSAERLPHHKQAPDTLVQLAAKQPSKISSMGPGAGSKPATTGVDGAGRSRTRGADSLSMLHRQTTITATSKAAAITGTTTVAAAATITKTSKAPAPRHFDHDEEVEVKFPDRRTSSAKGKQKPPQKTAQKQQPVSAGKPKPTSATKLTTSGGASASASASAASSKAKSVGAEKPLSWVESLGLQQDFDVTAGAGEDFGFDDVYPEGPQQQGRGDGDGFADGGGGFDNDFMDTEEPPVPPVQGDGEDGGNDTPPQRGDRKTTSSVRSAKKGKATASSTVPAPEPAPAASKSITGFAKFKGALQPLTSSALNARNSSAGVQQVTSPAVKSAAALAPKSAAKMRIGPSVPVPVAEPVTVGAAVLASPAPATHTKSTKSTARGKDTNKQAAWEKENAPLDAQQMSQEPSASRRFPLSPAVSVAASHAASNADARSTTSKRKFGHAFHPAPDAGDREVLSAMEWLATDDDSSSDCKNQENRTNRKRGRKNGSVSKKGKADASVASATKV